MKVADYIISRLEEYTDYVFQVYGSASASLVDAFTRYNKPKLICCQHEQAAGFMMEGYTKVTNRIGVGLATSGPGGMNFVTPIGNAFYDSFPALFITGQVHSRFMRPHDGIRQRGFQETDIVSIVKPITKYATMLTKAEDVRYELEKTIYLACEGRPGPVLLDIPLDIQKEEIDENTLIGFDRFKIEPVRRLEVDLFLNDLKNAERPVMLVGGGVNRNLTRLVTSVASSLNIPVFPTYNALDIVCSDNPYYGGRVGTYGGDGRNFAIQNCDLLLAIGTRVSGRIIGGNLDTWARGAKKYLVNIDSTSLEKKFQEVPFDVNIHSDAYTYLRFLRDSNAYWKSKGPQEWLLKCYEWRDKYDPVKPEFFETEEIHPYAFLRTLSEEMSKDDILCVDCGGNLVAINHAFKTKTGQVYITNNGNSPMGGSLCYGIGAEFGRLVAGRNGQVVIVIGDGGMMMNMQELQTIISYGVKIKLIILNNGIYGITKGFQKSNFESRHIACGGENREDYHPCDFRKLAGVFNIEYWLAKGKYYKEIIQDFLKEKNTILLDVDCKDFCDYLPKIGNWQASIEDQEPYLPRDEFMKNMYIEPTEFSKNVQCNT